MKLYLDSLLRHCSSATEDTELSPTVFSSTLPDGPASERAPFLPKLDSVESTQSFLAETSKDVKNSAFSLNLRRNS